MSICFIPFSYEKSWDYKSQAKEIRYKLGNDNCLLINTNITYKIHQKINLPYDKEVDILLLGIELLFIENIPLVTISHMPDNLDSIQLNYLNKLIIDGKVKVLYE